nr:MAG TPA: hypothetical protein [Caudoviricetes sp.]DAK08762.1 MAG TPA: hypothetical protein [Caudoviricetes sp.]
MFYLCKIQKLNFLIFCACGSIAYVILLSNMSLIKLFFAAF